MEMELLDKQLYKLLSNKELSPHDILNNYNIKLTIVHELSSLIYGFVYLSRLGSYHLIINGNINYMAQKRTFIHEIKHIISDMPQIGYIIGIDMQRTKLEAETDKIAESIALYG